MFNGFDVSTGTFVGGILHPSGIRGMLYQFGAVMLGIELLMLGFEEMIGMLDARWKKRREDQEEADEGWEKSVAKAAHDEEIPEDLDIEEPDGVQHRDPYGYYDDTHYTL